MPSTYHSITARWVGLKGLSCEDLLQRCTDKQRKRVYSKRVLGLDACGNSLDTLTGVEAYTQLLSLSVAKCRLDGVNLTVSVTITSAAPSCIAISSEQDTLLTPVAAGASCLPAPPGCIWQRFETASRRRAAGLSHVA